MSVILFGFLAGGLSFGFLILRGVAASARTYAWRETPCEIVSSRVARNPAAEDGADAFVFDVTYRYEAGGRVRVSRQFKPGYTGSDQVAEAARLAARYREGSRAVCYVDPANPAHAALERPSLWMAAAVLFPLVFVLVGAGGLTAVWWPARTEGAEEEGDVRAISTKAAGAGKALGCMAAFFGLFFVVGVAVFWFFFAKPALRILDARSWRETPCVVLSSAVRTHEGDDGDTYSVNVLYEYEVGGRTYQSNRYQFLGGSTGGRDAKAAAVAVLPPGRRTVCYVDPADPQEAVLNRSFTPEYWIGLVPLVFMIAGGGGIVWVRSLSRKAARDAREGAAWGPPAAEPAGSRSMRFAAAEPHGVESGPAVLEPTATPLTKFVLILLVALFWNGIVSVFVRQAFVGWRAGRPDGCLTLFLVPFALVGLLMVWGVFHQLLALFNPRPRLRLSSRSIPLGGSATLDWSFSGAAERIHRLRIVVEGREECRYRRGTDVHTDKETFATIAVAEAALLVRGASGSARFTIPAETMHSFTAASNKIVWTLGVKGEIRSWPDVEESFEILVRPAEHASGARA